MPKLSVIVPVYNAEKYLNNTIKSILSQDEKDFELILINDGSSDNSQTIIEDFKNKDERIKSYSFLNQGVAKTRNFGLSVATGKYVTFIDADDLIDSNAFSVMLNKIESEKADICFCYIKCFFEKTRETILREECNLRRVANDLKDIKYYFLLNDGVMEGNKYKTPYVMGSSCRTIFRLDLIKDNGVKFNENIYIAEDLIFLLDYLFFAKKGCMVDEYFYTYIINEKSATGDKYKPNLLASHKALHKEEERVILSSCMTDKEKEESLLRMKYLKAFQLVKNEVKYNPDCIKNLKKLKRDEFFSSLIKWKSFSVMKKDKRGKKERIYYLLIKLKAFRLLKRFYPNKSY